MPDDGKDQMARPPDEPLVIPCLQVTWPYMRAWILWCELWELVASWASQTCWQHTQVFNAHTGLEGANYTMDRGWTIPPLLKMCYFYSTVRVPVLHVCACLWNEVLVNLSIFLFYSFPLPSTFPLPTTLHHPHFPLLPHFSVCTVSSTQVNTSTLVATHARCLTNEV